MAAQILPFPKQAPPAASPVACFLRIGEAHRKLADLHAAGHLPARRVVIEASRLRHQQELVTALREAGAEIVLDTEAAELAAPGKYAGHSRRAPWALPEGNGPLGPEHFSKSAHRDVVGQIARFAIQSRVHVVLAPTHFLGDPAHGEWLSIDREACLALRASLDQEGGQDIAIDYSLIISNAMLNDPAARAAALSKLADLPFDNLWVRASGFGADAGPLAMKRYLEAIAGLHELGKPVVADFLGGLTGLAALAFGAVSGLAQGVGEHERFDASGWHRDPLPRKEGVRFGRIVRIGLPGLHRSVTLKELDLLASARGGRRLCGCSDRACCPHGYGDMKADPRGHAARQLFKSLAALEAVPDLRRETYFLNGPMAATDRTARQVKALRPQPTEAEAAGVDLDKLMKRLSKHSRHVEGMRAALEHAHDARGAEGPRARAIEPRRPSDLKSGWSRP